MKAVQIHPAIYRIETPFGQGATVYLYLLKGERLALVDTGAADSPRRILQPALAEIGLNLSDVEVILNTHVHTDHSGGNLPMRQISKPAIYTPALEVSRAESLDEMEEFAMAPLRELDFPPRMVEQRAIFTRQFHGEAAGSDVVLSDGDRVDLGGGLELTAVHTPGHTPGSTSYYWEREGVLFTGDSVQAQGGDAGAYPFYIDAPAYRRTVAKVAALALRMLCTSHAFVGGAPISNPTREGPEVGAFLQESARVSDALQAAVMKALQQMPGARKREIALAALSELQFQIPTLLVRETRMPWFGGPTLLAHLEAAMAGSYPEGL